MVALGRLGLASVTCVKVDYYYSGTPGSAAEAARQAERLGYDGFFSAETAHDPFLPLAIAAGVSRLELGTAIAVAFPRSPMVIAQTAWDLAAVSEGRFILGLGTQVKAHITRRFSGTWVSPAARLGEYIGALRAIWRSFQEGAPLAYQGEHYQFSLLTPFFNPGKIAHPEIPVTIAGVGPHLSRLAGEVCDGFHVHPFHTVRYLDEVVLPNIARGAKSAGRTSADVDRICPVFVVTGRDETEMAAARAAAKSQIAFYASTPSYRVVLDTHGWDFGDRLNQLSRQGDWAQMAAMITDEVLAEVAVVGSPEGIGPAIKLRYGDRVQRVGFYALEPLRSFPAEQMAAMVAATK